MQTIPPVFSSAARQPAVRRPEPLAVVALLAVAKDDIPRYPCGSATARAALTTSDAMRSIEALHPHVVVIDWDVTAIDPSLVCRTAAQRTSTVILITTQFPDRVPSALKCGCHSVLLKPFSVNLAAARLGRIVRDTSMRMSPGLRTIVEQGTNRTWPEVPCPSCATAGAVSFDFASHRLWWYACQKCDHVWRGARRE